MTVASISSCEDFLLSCVPKSDHSKVFYTAATKLVGVRNKLADLPNSILFLKNQDPVGQALSCLSKDELSTIFIDEITLLNSLPHLYHLQSYPVILNVDLHLQDYSVVAALQDIGISILVSNTVDNLKKNSQYAHKVATQALSPVIHFVNSIKIDQGISTKLTAPLIHFEEFSSKEPVPVSDILVADHYKVYGDAASSATFLVVNLSGYAQDFAKSLPASAILIDIKIYRPWNFKELLELVPPTVSKIAIVQGSNRKTEASKYEPLLFDFLAEFNTLMERDIQQVVLSNIGLLSDPAAAIRTILSNLDAEFPNESLYIGTPFINDKESKQIQSAIVNVLNLENAYLKLLHQLFASNLEILNEYSNKTVQANDPAYGYGFFLSKKQKREGLLALAKQSLDSKLYDFDDGITLIENLSEWIHFHDKSIDEATLNTANTVAIKVFDLLQKNKTSAAVQSLLTVGPTLDDYKFYSRWLIGSDMWSYDLGNSGVHQVLSSGSNVNVLLIDSEPYTSRKLASQRKKDVGLYAMNFRNVYVASVAVYGSYTQLLSALIEASKFEGPSIVLAYLPYTSENDTALEVLKETKIAIEAGYWPLYRYDPSKRDDTEVFKLDSSLIRRELQNFLDQENKLTLLTRNNALLARNLEQSASDRINETHKKKAKIAYEQLLQGLSGAPLFIYYASDGGNASSLAKKLGTRAAARGLKPTVLSLDDAILEDIQHEENVVFITSTAGQGEFPQDGKSFWDQLKSATDLDFSNTNVAVFGLGDSLYWPRKEDKHYYNKPSKDLFKRLEILSARPLIPLGLGDDQDADGFQTGYQPWETLLWEALGVAGAVVADEPKELTNEDMKAASNFLRGTIKEGIEDQSTGAVCSTDQQLTKFHGFYMQDDRDVRDTRKAQGLEPYYSFMIRARLPGGRMTPAQWLTVDRLADEQGVGTIKLTTRATIQLHGILKGDVKHTLRAMNSTLMDTLAACGDVNRNVTVTALPSNAKVHEQVSSVAADISNAFLPHTTAYHEIWLEGLDERDWDRSWPSIFENRVDGPKKKKTLVAGNALVDMEPIYSPVYLPRKFKVNITVPPYNDVDVWSSDVGLIAIVDQNAHIVEGFNLYAGGGMGTTHNNKKTYPRTGSSFGFVKKEDVIKAIEAIMILQRDNGDRTNRKHARLKYTIDDMGTDVFKEKVEELWGKAFEPERPFEIVSNIDYFGWVKDENGLNHCTIFIENGRVADTVDLPHKAGLRKVAQLMQKHGSGHFRLTGNQHPLICGIEDKNLEEIKKVLREYKLDDTNFSGLRLSSASCVALPSCGLAMAEAERYLPLLITKIENILEEYGLRHDSIVMRMTGCPNGCSRPWLAELALIGKAPGTYNLMLGGGYHGQRLNKLYRASIQEEEILEILQTLFKRWAAERDEGEHFGDFLIRVGVINPTFEGKYFHEDLPVEVI